LRTRPPLDDRRGAGPPHDGLIVELPDGGGFVEVVQKKPTSSKGPLDKELSFYFLKDMTTPLAPSPSSGTLTIGKKSVELRADGEALVTPPGPPLFYQGDLGGILKVDIAGTSKDVPLRVR